MTVVHPLVAASPMRMFPTHRTSEDAVDVGGFDVGGLVETGTGGVIVGELVGTLEGRWVGEGLGSKVST